MSLDPLNRRKRPRVEDVSEVAVGNGVRRPRQRGEEGKAAGKGKDKDGGYPKLKPQPQKVMRTGAAGATSRHEVPIMPRNIFSATGAVIHQEQQPAPKQGKASKQAAVQNADANQLNYVQHAYPYPLSYHAYPGTNIQYQTPALSALAFLPPQQVYGGPGTSQTSAGSLVAAPGGLRDKKELGGLSFDAVEFTLEDARQFLRNTFKLSIEFGEPLANFISCSQTSFIRAIRAQFEKKRASAQVHKKSQVSFTVAPIPIPVFRRLFKDNDVGTSSTRTQSNHTRETITIQDTTKLEHIFGKGWDEYQVLDELRVEEEPGKEQPQHTKKVVGEPKGQYRVSLDEKKCANIKITYEPATETLKFNSRYTWLPAASQAAPPAAPEATW